MATITKRIVVCDVCRSIDAPVTSFRAAFGGGRLRTYALCDTHGTPVKELLSGLGGGATTTAPRRASKVLTLDQIESVKATRAPAKRGKKEVPPTGFVGAP